MKISAFTFIKNGAIYNYPFLESINSILPLIDEFVINVGESEDSTLELVKENLAFGLFSVQITQDGNGAFKLHAPQVPEG